MIMIAHSAHVGDAKNCWRGIPAELNMLFISPQSAYIIHHIMHVIDIEMTTGRKKITRNALFNLLGSFTKTAMNKAIDICIKVRMSAKNTVIMTDL